MKILQNKRDGSGRIIFTNDEIKILNDELFEIKNKDKNVEQTYRKNEGMWAENPDASHIKDE